MSFNFKQELENLDFETPEGIAKIILELIVKQLKEEHKSFKDLHSLKFSLEKPSRETHPHFHYWVVKTYYMLKYRSGRTSDWIYIHKWEYGENQAISIVEAIEKELKREGLNCQDITYNYTNCPVKTFEVIF